MRDLHTALEDHELVTLRVIGDWWELDLTGADKAACVKALAERLRQLDLALELNYLPTEESDALQAVAQAGGKMAVGAFVRQFGDVRQMGPGRLEREEPWLAPDSPAEALWYRGLLYRGFDHADENGNLVEYYYAPDEFVQQLTASASPPPAPPSPAGTFTAVEPPESVAPASTTAVDDLTTLLAFAQKDELSSAGIAGLEFYLFDPDAHRSSLLLTLAKELDLLRDGAGSLRPTRTAVNWLKQSRAAQNSSLAEAWSASGWNELCHTPGIRCEGSGWENDPVLARNALLDQLPRDQQWHSIDSLIGQIKRLIPDFQRPEGNYDTWYIRDVERDLFVKGFENWDLVEGRLLRFLLEGPMTWLGLIQSAEGRFKLTEAAIVWLSDQAAPEQEVRVPLVVQADAVVLVPFNAGRYERFQVARIALQAPLQIRELSEPYRYHITPSSLARARKEGIEPERVLAFLKEASGRAIPASVKRGIERWTQNGLEGRLQMSIILRVRDAQILDTLQSNPKTRAYIGERLGELAAVVVAADWREFQSATAELGLLLDPEATS